MNKDSKIQLKFHASRESSQMHFYNINRLNLNLHSYSKQKKKTVSLRY